MCYRAILLLSMPTQLLNSLPPELISRALFQEFLHTPGERTFSRVCVCSCSQQCPNTRIPNITATTNDSDHENMGNCTPCNNTCNQRSLGGSSVKLKYSGDQCCNKNGLVSHLCLCGVSAAVHCSAAAHACVTRRSG